MNPDDDRPVTATHVLTPDEHDYFFEVLNHHGPAGMLTTANVRNRGTGVLETVLFAIKPMGPDRVELLPLAVVILPTDKVEYDPPAAEDNPSVVTASPGPGPIRGLYIPGTN